MESRWPELPCRALELIIGMLGIQDIVNLAKACEKWRKVAVQSLKSVVIEGSLPFNGSWKNLNYCNWPKFSESSLTDHFISGTIESIGDFATSLAEVTDQIEHLYFSGNFIPARAYRVLLCSQRAIKTLHVKKKPLPSRFVDRYGEDPISCIPTELRHEQLEMVIAEGVLRHEASLEDISISLETDSAFYERDSNRLIPFIDVVRTLGDKEEYFPNLTSVTLLSTTSGEFYFFNRGPADLNLVEEIRCTELFFERTFKENKLTKLDAIPQRYSTTNENVFCNPLCTMLFLHYLKSGRFSNLSKIDLDALSICGSAMTSMELTDILIQNCPNITHIECCYSLGKDDVSLMKMIKHYGPQLLHLNSSNIGVETAKYIAQYCCNLESLGVVSKEEFSCLPALKNLKKLELYKSMEEADPNIDFLGRLTELNADGLTHPGFLNAIRQKARKIEVLKIGISPDSLEDFMSMVDIFLQCLEKLHCLKELYFRVSGFWMNDEEWEEGNWKRSDGDELINLILKNQSELKRLHIDSEMFVNMNEAILLERMPHCEITLDYDMFNY